jgi:hypothetical protein
LALRDRRRVHLPVHRRTFISEPLCALLFGFSALDRSLSLFLYPRSVRRILGRT